MSSQTSFFALACGDSYGSCFENEGLCGVTFDIKSLPDKPSCANITDDTKMAMILLKNYNAHKKFNESVVKKQYQKWAEEEGRADGIGLHTKDVLINNSCDKNSQGNGALMRVIPFGLQLIEDGYSFEKAVEMMNMDSFITHKNETICMANRLSLDLALNGIKVLEKGTYKDMLQKLHRGYSAWVMHTLYIVIKALKADLSFLDGFKYIVSFGGDTDTNCAIYGAIRGYKKDISNEINMNDFISNFVQFSARYNQYV